ncbi:Autophagy protein 7 [Dispira parvispora]|uniref:Ubiquitin-like modifier-activating enzyme ATG7 n=1 Tax=Dispira parvispora TaxID=1520584 RepID=A0A9W8ARR8_9FUNG|nr:Autophagy protein 7 [Dispira parvispora]
MASPTPLQFEPLLFTIDPTFWHTLTDLKLNQLRLDVGALSVTGYYSPGRQVSVSDESPDHLRALPATLRLSSTAFHTPEETERPSPGSWTVPVRGELFNTNTIEDFTKLDRRALLAQATHRVWRAVHSGAVWDDPTLLNTLLVTSFANLKWYRYYYRCAWPVLPLATPAQIISIQPLDEVWSSQQCTQLRVSYPQAPFFTVYVDQSSDTVQVLPFAEFARHVRHNPPTEANDKQLWLGFLDPSGLPNHPGWPLRNALYCIQRLYAQIHQSATEPVQHVVVNVVACRPTGAPRSEGATAMPRDGTRVLQIRLDCSVLDDSPSTELPVKPVGWEKHPQGKSGPRFTDLGSSMDPISLATTSLDFNLRLMKWRVAPDLNLEIVRKQRCLLLGAGTLGTYVARSLLAWGVTQLTLADCSRVSFSNPFRQALYTFEDCLEGGQWKAEAAVRHLTEIYPKIQARAVRLAIPMPGHPVPADQKPQVAEDLATLEELIRSHDTVFLLTDSRESRWLPTLLGAYYDKVVINAALGFDSFLVMRHGALPEAWRNPKGMAQIPKAGEVDPDVLAGRLGCYFCNDVVAPTDSLRDRTLDQQCTVTRPGLAPLASATAVELLVTLLQHPRRSHAPPLSPSNTHSFDSSVGLPPHQIRGFLRGFHLQNIVGSAFDKCTACSHTVLSAYRDEGYEFLWKVFDNYRPKDAPEPTGAVEYNYLETLTGLEALKLQAESLLDNMTWDSEDDNDESATIN